MELPIPSTCHNELPDDALIQRFQAGESRLFDQLYNRHRDHIYGVIFSIVSNREDASDLTQEVFLKAYQGLDRFQNESTFSTWIYRIAVNHSIDYIRRQTRRVRLREEPSFADKTYYDHPYHAALDTEEFFRRVRDALPSLTPSQRTVYTLRYEHQLPLKDIADRLGRSIGTVKAHLFHAHRRLRHNLRPYFESKR